MKLWSSLLTTVFFFVFGAQAIAHYEQAADYYKGEESNRYMWCFKYHSNLNELL